MLSNKSYLIRAFYEWIVDSQCTPLLVINVKFPRCQVPQEFVENGEIILNISPTAIRELKLGNELIEFQASFNSIVHLISAPVKSILAIYAEENGQGMFFDYEDADASDTEWTDSSIVPKKEKAAQAQDNGNNRPSYLKLVE